MYGITLFEILCGSWKLKGRIEKQGIRHISKMTSAESWQNNQDWDQRFKLLSEIWSERDEGHRMIGEEEARMVKECRAND